ncbi:MAG: hypothetical protein ACK40I_12375 [Tabrizicola sp.]
MGRQRGLLAAASDCKALGSFGLVGWPLIPGASDPGPAPLVQA